VIRRRPLLDGRHRVAVSSGERVTLRHGIGLSVAFLGILVLVGPDILLHGGGLSWSFLAGVLALQVACAGWSVGSSYGKRLGGGVPPMTTAALQMLWGGIWMTLGATVAGEWSAPLRSLGVGGALPGVCRRPRGVWWLHLHWRTAHVAGVALRLRQSIRVALAASSSANPSTSASPWPSSSSSPAWPSSRTPLKSLRPDATCAEAELI
jgi:hypothetical protein